jgi:hypothetical protein
VSIGWSVSGQVTRVSLLVNNNPVWDYAPVSGSYQDCPATIGTQVYTLQAFGPEGTSAQQTAVSVQSNPQPTTPTPTPSGSNPQQPVINGFTLSPDQITPGACTTVSWTTSGGTTRVQLRRDNAVIWDNAPLSSSVQDCPQVPPDRPLPFVIVYTLYAFNNAGQQTVRTLNLTVSAP